MVRILALPKVALFAAALAYAQAPTKDMMIYFTDTEGGQATLYIAPSGESLLVDTGNPGGRDTGRIMDVIHDAGLTQIDYLVLTHYHVDHVGGLQELAGRIPIRNFIDHGPTVEEREQVPGFQKLYPSIYEKGAHRVVKPGDKIPIRGLDVLVVTAANQVLKKPLPGAGKTNPECATFKRRDEADDENAQSVGMLFTYGKYRTINLGDFTWNSEYNLMCPNNPIGTVDLYLTSHHGIDRSGSAVLVHALHPVVAVMHNGPRKGGTQQTMEILHTSPGLQDIWQLHWAYAGGTEYNAPGQFIANEEEPAAMADALVHPPAIPTSFAPAAAAGRESKGGGRGPGGAATGHTPAYWIKVTARADGSFTVVNTRNNFSKTYQAQTR